MNLIVIVMDILMKIQNNEGKIWTLIGKILKNYQKKK